MTPKVFDFDGTERDWAWLQATYGNVRVIAAPAGMEAFRLTELHVSHAEATIQVAVRGKDGSPCASQPVANTWPNIQVDPAHGNVDLNADPALRTVYAHIACVQRTSSDGETGFGLGTGSYIQNMADGGPNIVWVLSPSAPSDVVAGIGMLGGTPHWGPLRPRFQLVASDGGTTPPPVDPPPSDGTTLRQRLAVAEQALTGLDAQVAAALAAVRDVRALVG